MFSKELLGTIQDTLDYIETNLSNKITLQQLSQHSHLSKFHLHRLLRCALGLPVMDYIRARKITSSLDPLFSQDLTVLKVALLFAFEHEQSYIRAFKKQFGITPAAFRNKPVDVILTEKADLSHILRVNDGVLFRPIILFKQGMLVTGKLFNIDIAENLINHTGNLAGNEFYYHIRSLINHKINENTYIGLTRYRWDEGVFATTYLPSVQVASVGELAQDMKTDVIPGGKYAVYTYIGSFHPRKLTISHLQQIWSCIERGNESFYQSEPFHFEVINESIATEDYCEVNIYIPIKSTTSFDSY